MATRSRIGLQLSDDSIVSVYCHYDGYPAHNGRILCTHYDTIEKVRELIDGGDMSCACLLYTSPSPRDVEESRMPSSA